MGTPPRKKMPLSKAGKAAKIITERKQAIAAAPVINKKEDLMTVENLAKPVHLLVSGYQAEALLTLVDLMRNATSEPVKKQAATELLSLGGHSSEIIKLQAIMAGRTKDISQMSNAELETFVAEARRKVEMNKLIASENAPEVIEGNAEIVVETSGKAQKDPDIVKTPSPLDALKARETEDFGL